MTDDQPRASSLKVGLAIVAVPILTFVGCAYLADNGRTYTGRGPWEMNALGCFVLAGVLAIACYRLAFKSGPSFALHEDRIEHFTWKAPIYFRDIEQVVFEPGQFWLKKTPTLALRLKNGSLQHLPYSLMTHDPRAFATLLTDALARFKTEDAGVARVPAPDPVTGP